MSSLPGLGTPDNAASLFSESSVEQPAASSAQSSSEVPDFFSNLSLPPRPSQPEDSGPPVGRAYPPPRTDSNPMRAKGKERLKYNLYVTASRNNTIATFTRPNGNQLCTFSGGKVGFKGVKRASYEAGYQCAVTIFQRILKEKEQAGSSMCLELLFSGFGQGRDAMYRALMSEEGAAVRDMVFRITDFTPIKIGGTRAKKTRRL
ncbi:unnamed protein product [Somion occarium]